MSSLRPMTGAPVTVMLVPAAPSAALLAATPAEPIPTTIVPTDPVFTAEATAAPQGVNSTGSPSTWRNHRHSALHRFVSKICHAIRGLVSGVWRA
jgi:hypothetical protein